MVNSKFQEININQTILNEKIAILEKLLDGTDYCRTGKGSYLWRGYGLTHDSINQMIDELNYIETEMKGLIQITVSALRKGSFEFADADSLASNLIQNIDGSLVHTGNSGQTHGGDGGRIDGTPFTTYKYNDVLYTQVIQNFDEHIMSQNAYDGETFGYGKHNCGCTSTAWCMGLSMITGKEYNPTTSDMWNNGALFPGQGNSIRGNESGMLQEAYKQLLNGKPSVFYAEHPYNVMHAVTIVGISPSANVADLKLSDFLVIDPWGGSIKTLDQVGYSGGYNNDSRLITYGENLP